MSNKSKFSKSEYKNLSISLHDCFIKFYCFYYHMEKIHGPSWYDEFSNEKCYDRLLYNYKVFLKKYRSEPYYAGCINDMDKLKLINLLVIKHYAKEKKIP